MPDSTPERHDPLPNATCGAERNHGHMDDVTHVCRWLSHADTTHHCKCGYMWDSVEPTFDERVRAGFAPALVNALKGQEADGELGRLRNRIAALEANGAELLARAERAEDVIEKVRELLFAFADWPDRDATDFLFRLGRHEMVYRIVGYAFPDELDKVELKPALDAPNAPHSPAEPVSPVSTPTEAHGETGEAQEG